MLVLLFWIGKERWAIAAADIVDIIPYVALQSLPHSNQQLSGLVNYRSQQVPVVDVAQWLGQSASPQSMSTRIALVNAPTETADSNGECNSQTTQLLGLILDRACETMVLSTQSILPSSHDLVKATIVGPSEEMVQQLSIAPIAQKVFGAASTAERLADPPIDMFSSVNGITQMIGAQ